MTHTSPLGGHHHEEHHRVPRHAFDRSELSRPTSAEGEVRRVPSRPLHYCAVARCPSKVTKGRYCARHQERASTYGGSWDTVRKAFRLSKAENVVCAICKVVLTPAVKPQVDHIIPFRGDRALRDSFTNLRMVCARCHAQRHAEDRRG